VRGVVCVLGFGQGGLQAPSARAVVVWLEISSQPRARLMRSPNSLDSRRQVAACCGFDGVSVGLACRHCVCVCVCGWVGQSIRGSGGDQDNDQDNARELSSLDH